MKNKITRVAIYTRVSTRDKGQDPENQRRQLHEYIKTQSWTFVEEFTDKISGSTADKRNDFKRMMDEASRRKFDVVLVWALDRFTREGILKTFKHIEYLVSYGVAFESYTEAHFRTTGFAGELMIAIAAWIAKQERIRTIQRIHAGLDVARSKNVHLGRAPLAKEKVEAILSMRGKGSVRSIAAKLGVSKSVVGKVLSTKGVPIVASAIDETRVAF